MEEIPLPRPTESSSPPIGEQSSFCDLVIQNVNIFDGRTVLQGRHDVGIGGHSITNISRSRLAGKTVIDGDGGWLMPGLIDTHVHLVDFSVVTDPDTLGNYMENIAPSHCAHFLEHGITTVKSVGDPATEILELRTQLAAGALRGPRLLVTGCAITGRDGHPSSTLFGGNRWYAARAVGEVDSVQMMRDLVHHLADRKVDAIKLVSEGACCDPGSPKYIWQNPVFPISVELVRLPPAILRAGIDAAHERGLRATVHSVQQDAAREAMDAGADGLEHGVSVEPITNTSLLAAIRDRGMVYTPTLWIKAAMHPSAMANARLVMDAGIRIACGSDSFPARGKLGLNSIEEIELLVAAGLTPVQALIAATSEAANHLDRRDIGVLECGKAADLILLAGNPLETIGNIRTLRLTLINGKIVFDGREARS